MEHYKIHIERTAAKDMRKIGKYISLILFSHILAGKLMIEINQKLQILKVFPEAYQVSHNYIDKSKIYRRAVVKNYSIIYYVLKEENKVVVTHIYYNKRKVFNF